MQIDPKRTVRAVRNRIEGGLGGADTPQPGEMWPNTLITSGTLTRQRGYHAYCPGCARLLWLPTEGPGRSWQPTGDLDAGTLSLTPEIQDTHGCNWTGTLTDGQFTPV